MKPQQAHHGVADEKYPNLGAGDYYFIFNGSKIKRNMTLEGNNIDNGSRWLYNGVTEIN